MNREVLCSVKEVLLQTAVNISADSKNMPFQALNNVQDPQEQVVEAWLGVYMRHVHQQSVQDLVSGSKGSLLEYNSQQ